LRTTGWASFSRSTMYITTWGGGEAERGSGQAEEEEGEVRSLGVSCCGLDHLRRRGRRQ
jgi:hypothetical protein